MNFKEFLNKFQKVPVEHYPHQVNKKPFVSVCVQTYQHVDYIRQCLDGILMQETNFPFEVLLGDDASTDGTREICIEYTEKYPDKIKLFLHHRENNIMIGGSPTGRFNFIYNLFSAGGKYIALCEGDDYWTDSNKLQKQVDYLEENEDYSLVETLRKNIKSNGEVFGEVMKGGTRTMMFRTKDTPSLHFVDQIPHGDNLLRAYLKQKGKFHCIPEIMAVWRMHEGGVWGGLQNPESETKLQYKRGLTDLGVSLSLIKDDFQKEGLSHLQIAIMTFIKIPKKRLTFVNKVKFIYFLTRQILINKQLFKK